MATAQIINCLVCMEPVRPRQQGVQCDGCFRWSHRICNTGKFLKKFSISISCANIPIPIAPWSRWRSCPYRRPRAPDSRICPTIVNVVPQAPKLRIRPTRSLICPYPMPRAPESRKRPTLSLIHRFLLQKNPHYRTQPLQSSPPVLQSHTK